MSALVAARLVFWMIFLVGLGGFLVLLWRFTQVRDEAIHEWTIPGATEVELEPGQYRIWLLQDPPGERYDHEFRDYWFQGWEPRLVGADGRPGRPEGVHLRPLQGVNEWRDNRQRPVSVALIRSERSATLRIETAAGNPEAGPVEARLLLARSSLEHQDQLILWMMGWLVGGLLTGIGGFALAAGLVPPAGQDRSQDRSQSHRKPADPAHRLGWRDRESEGEDNRIGRSRDKRKARDFKAAGTGREVRG